MLFSNLSDRSSYLSCHIYSGEDIIELLVTNPICIAFLSDPLLNIKFEITPMATVDHLEYLAQIGIDQELTESILRSLRLAESYWIL